LKYDDKDYLDREQKSMMKSVRIMMFVIIELYEEDKCNNINNI